MTRNNINQNYCANRGGEQTSQKAVCMEADNPEKETAEERSDNADDKVTEKTVAAALYYLSGKPDSADSDYYEQ
jgi:hypothetical protein